MGIKKRIKSFAYAFKGMRGLFFEPNARIHAVVGVIVLACGFWLHIATWEWVVVAICIGGVLMGEAFNTAIEALADKISPDIDPLIGKAKDLGAAAVLFFVFGAVVAGLIIFLPKFLALL